MSRSELTLAAEVETRLLVLYILLFPFAHCFFFFLFHAWGLFDWCLREIPCDLRARPFSFLG